MFPAMVNREMVDQGVSLSLSVGLRPMLWLTLFHEQAQDSNELPPTDRGLSKDLERWFGGYVLFGTPGRDPSIVRCLLLSAMARSCVEMVPDISADFTGFMEYAFEPALLDYALSV
jgi:hypothetical protein